MTVRLHIERLVVEGLELSAAEGARLRRAMEEELEARFAADDGATWSDFSVPALQPLHIGIPSRDARELGRQAAETLNVGLKR